MKKGEHLMEYMLFSAPTDDGIVPFACGEHDTCKGCRGCKGCNNTCKGCTGGLFIG